MAVARRPIHERASKFYERGDSEDCWIWQGCKARGGYGQIWDGERMVVAHRAVYELLIGPVPEGLTLDHLCRVTSCVNPAHLEPVTLGENNRRGTSPSAVNAAKTHCLRGHEFTDANTLVCDGRRRCRACGRDRYHQLKGAR